MMSSAIQQTVTGDHNIFTATGDINVTYHLPPAEAADHHNLHILLDRVNAFWVRGVLEHSVASEMAHELLKDHVADAVAHPWESVLELPGRDARLLERTDPVKPIYDQVGRSLLILGEPGSGKTITLLELARDLVQAARTDPSQPVPVVLNLSSWAGQPLQRWLVDELKTKYFVAERMGRPLLEKNRLALLLDGLDEVAMDKQAACVEAINAFTESYGVPGLVVSSRVNEYTALPVRLRLHGAIRLSALTREQIDNYLSTLGSDLVGLRAALEEDEALVTLAQSPLMLSVMSIAYRGRTIETPDGHGDSLVDARRAQIFDSYADQMFARKGGGETGARRSEEEGWLASLANRMRDHNQTVFTIEGMQPSWLPGSSQRLIYALQSRLIPGVILGVTEGAYLGGIGLMENPFPTDLLLGLLLGIAFALGAGSFDWIRMELSMRSAKTARRTNIAVVAMSLLAYFLIFAVPFVLLWGEDARLRVTFGIVWAVLFAARVRMPAARTDIRAVEALAWSWGRAVKGLAAGFGVGLAFSVTMLLVFSETFLGDDPRPWTYPILSPFIYASLGALFGGIATTTMESKTIPNQGMGLSLRNARFGGLLIGSATFVGTVLLVIGPPIYFSDPMLPWVDVFAFSLLVGVYFGILAALWFGGLDFIYHWTLRRRLSATGVLPQRLPSFLEQMSRLALVQRVGGGYIFLHRLLLEHFADRASLPATATRAGDA
jgi:hypothetical protein